MATLYGETLNWINLY